MSLEIIKDPYVDAVAVHLQLDPSRHMIWPDGEWIRWARRVTGLRDLFIYQHKEAGTWVLACWIYSPKQATRPVCNELKVFDYPPDHLGERALGRWELEALTTKQGDELVRIRKIMEKRDYARKAEKLDRYQKKAELVQHYEKAGKPEIARGIRNRPAAPLHDPAPELSDQLLTAARERVITSG